MSASFILAAIEEYIEAKKEGKDTVLARKKFAKTLNDYIDFRIKASSNEEHNINLVNTTDLLINAPKPPLHIENISEFLKEYLKWYSHRCIFLNEKFDSDILDELDLLVDGIFSTR